MWRIGFGCLAKIGVPTVDITITPIAKPLDTESGSG